MAESAARLDDEVFPERPVRQWVLSAPLFHGIRGQVGQIQSAPVVIPACASVVDRSHHVCLAVCVQGEIISLFRVATANSHSNS